MCELLVYLGTDIESTLLYFYEFRKYFFLDFRVVICEVFGNDFIESPYTLPQFGVEVVFD